MRILVLLIITVAVVKATTCGTCNDRGTCSTTTGICTCFAGFTGHQCEERTCPTGRAWTDYASATDTAHAVSTECSNMGLCNRVTGLCTCASGFEGVACERMSCATCSNNGRCISMREAATLKDDRNFFTATTYNLWDADMVFGCLCDYGYTGHNCAKRECPTGDDPGTTGQAEEIQQLSCLCDGCSGAFSLSYKGLTTANIDPGASLATFETTLEALKNMEDVTVSLSGGGSTVCDSDGAVVSITFIKNPGNSPALVINNALTGGTSNIAIADATATALYDGNAASVDGTRENAPCSNRGTCDYTTGICACDTGFGASDGAGSTGTIGDCGFGTPSACPTTTNGACDGHGTCSGATAWTCSCTSGWEGHDCSDRSCPTDVAWFDEASAADTAHATGATCSNKGTCVASTGTCTCDSGFEGSACNQLSCPGTNSTATCNGHGTCKTMQELALLSASNGDLLGVTYGNVPNKVLTWDYDMLKGCHCDSGYYMGPYIGDLSDFQAYDCSRLSCPYGDDPVVTGKVDETQTVACLADGGTFTLTFRQQTTTAIAYDATADAVKAALEALSTVTTASVTFSTGVAACSVSTVTSTIVFTYEQGNLPIMASDSTSLTSSGAAVSLVVAETVPGTKDNIECSRRGLCDRTNGTCSCYEGFLSSDGTGAVGTRGDCGHKSSFSTT